MFFNKKKITASIMMLLVCSSFGLGLSMTDHKAFANPEPKTDMSLTVSNYISTQDEQTKRIIETDRVSANRASQILDETNHLYEDFGHSLHVKPSFEDKHYKALGEDVASSKAYNYYSETKYSNGATSVKHEITLENTKNDTVEKITKETFSNNKTLPAKEHMSLIWRNNPETDFTFAVLNRISAKEGKDIFIHLDTNDYNLQGVFLSYRNPKTGMKIHEELYKDIALKVIDGKDLSAYTSPLIFHLSFVYNNGDTKEALIGYNTTEKDVAFDGSHRYDLLENQMQSKI